jgi:hypothetical protein
MRLRCILEVLGLTSMGDGSILQLQALLLAC